MRLAILIIGVQNSGKTSTIKHLVNTHSDKSLNVMRAGWQSIFLDSSFKYLKLNFFCVPASPTETKKMLSIRFPSFIPEVLIIAEQLGGANYPDTISFLNRNNFAVATYNLSNSIGTSDWDKFDNTNKSVKLNNRTNQIINDIKLFIKTNNII
ncbi:hypothetical protein [Flavobacterium sp.]|uniref:hypothetical protein n=1 Tax=Flavobacterium sp. TaxID=239 RepID=UPI003D6AC1F7